MGKTMPLANYLAALDTVLAVVLTLALGIWAGIQRGRYKIAAPATTGHPQFERAFRSHANTIENLVLFLPLLWVATVFYGGQIPFWIGLVWIVSRLLFAIGYAQTNAQLREPGAVLGYASLIALLALSAIGLA
jgi:glutathione S-transferase